MKKLKRKKNHVAYQAVYFPAWNGEHKRCLDAFIIGASFGCLCHCLLPKTNFKMHKNALFLPTSSELSRFSFINTDATNNLQNIQHTCNIHLQWGFHLGILHFSSIGVLLYHRNKSLNTYKKKQETGSFQLKSSSQEDKQNQFYLCGLNTNNQKIHNTSFSSFNQCYKSPAL